jgi:hypothetical protein
MPPTPRTITIFYAWQSDLPEQFNHHAIRQALNRAAAQLAEEASATGQTLTVIIDDATRAMVGSGHIPTSIIQKIRSADFFVGDISALNANETTQRKTPNPNVVYELGYAAAEVGWERILMLINTALGGTADDMPFDFDRHRASMYMLGEGQGAQGALNTLVLTALRNMVTADAPRPNANLFNEATVRHERDLMNLRWLLRAVHLPTLDDHVSSSPKRVTAASVYFSEVLGHTLGSSQFYLYDEELRNIVSNFVHHWAESTNPDDYFSDHPNPHYFLYIASNGEARMAELEQARGELRSFKDQLLGIIRTRYPEIDLQQTSPDALSRYEKHMESVEGAL